MIERFKQARAAGTSAAGEVRSGASARTCGLPRSGTTREMKDLDWTLAGLSRSWKTDQKHVGAVYLVAPSKGVIREGDTPLGPRAASVAMQLEA
jgi:hypothetical protein